MSKKLRKLVESFGENVVKENFGGDDIANHYLEKDMLRESDEEKVDHLTLCEELGRSEILKIIGQCTDQDLDLSEENMDPLINDVCKFIYSCAELNEDVGVDGDQVNVGGASASYFKEGIAELASGYRTSSLGKIDGQDYEKVIKEVLDDSQIVLLRNLIYNDGNFTYKNSHRQDIMDHVKKFDNSPVSRIIKTVYFKENSDIYEVADEMGVEAAQQVQKDSISLTESKGELLVASKQGRGYSLSRYKFTEGLMTKGDLKKFRENREIDEYYKIAKSNSKIKNLSQIEEGDKDPIGKSFSLSHPIEGEIEVRENEGWGGIEVVVHDEADDTSLDGFRKLLEANTKTYDSIKTMFGGADLEHIRNMADGASSVVEGTDGKNYNVTYAGDTDKTDESGQKMKRGKYEVTPV